jgi:Tol biopolymer transport system component
MSASQCRYRARATWGMIVCVALVTLASRASAGARARRFIVEQNPYVLGQAMDWLDRTHVVWHDPMIRDEDGDGQTNIYNSTLDGAEKRCLTCGLQGRHQVPVAQPHGDWILFHSWSGHSVTIGGPGFGGLGSDVWVMRRDGSQRTNLTASTELHDNFHAYWSPDGRYIVWSALNWNAAEGGNGRSDVRVARFDPSGPRLVDEHVVRPGNGHWYETQWWAPDGSGFLYTETADLAINPELFFCRLPRRAGGECRPVRLTQDLAWDEQAIFTPDMNRIIFMSSRNLPGAHNDWAAATALLDLPADYDYALILSVFTNNFLQPILEQATDLYELRLRWNRARTRFKPGAVRRLTTSGEQGWVIPEFTWDPSGRRLLWTQNKFNGGRRVDQGCAVRQLRAAFITRLAGVSTITQVPFTIDVDIRETAASLLRDPRAFTVAGGGCGGEAPTAEPALEQETWIGRYE